MLILNPHNVLKHTEENKVYLILFSCYRKWLLLWWKTFQGLEIKLLAIDNRLAEFVLRYAIAISIPNRNYCSPTLVVLRSEF